VWKLPRYYYIIFIPVGMDWYGLLNIPAGVGIRFSFIFIPYQAGTGTGELFLRNSYQSGPSIGSQTGFQLVQGWYYLSSP